MSVKTSVISVSATKGIGNTEKPPVISVSATKGTGNISKRHKRHR